MCKNSCIVRNSTSQLNNTSQDMMSKYVEDEHAFYYTSLKNLSGEKFLHSRCTEQEKGMDG